MADTEDTFTRVFAEAGKRYEPPVLVLYNDEVQSACGFSTAATGPFYCPADRKLYLDLSFFRELGERFGAPGDFAQAYVVAHEVGHHLQTILGISADIARMEAQMNETGRNAMSVRQELQADCFAGVWGHHANRDRKMLEPGDVEEGLAAASAIGDDRLTGGRVSPPSRGPMALPSSASPGSVAASRAASSTLAIRSRSSRTNAVSARTQSRHRWNRVAGISGAS